MSRIGKGDNCPRGGVFSEVGTVPRLKGGHNGPFSCSFDYDVYEYVVNEKDRKSLPEGISKIEIVVE